MSKLTHKKEFDLDKSMTKLDCEWEDIDSCYGCGVNDQCRFFEKYKEVQND